MQPPLKLQEIIKHLNNNYHMAENTTEIFSRQNILTKTTLSPFELGEVLSYYLSVIGVAHHLYYQDYSNDNKILWQSNFLIFQYNHKFYYFLCQLPLIKSRGFLTLNDCITFVYKKFQEECSLLPTGEFYLNEYLPLKEGVILPQVKPAGSYGLKRAEISSMAIVFYQDKVLILKTKDNKFVLPKGHIENNESPLETAIRECYEESGVILTPDDFRFSLPSYQYSFSGSNFHGISNNSFYEIFKTHQITKTIMVNVFVIAKKQKPFISETQLFYSAKFMPWKDFLTLAKTQRHDHDYNNVSLAIRKLKE